MNNTTPSAQTEWEEIFKLLVVKECREMDTVREAYREPINNIIKFMRTRLLSVEKIRLKSIEKVLYTENGFFREDGNVASDVQESIQVQRQSILSDMEKGSV